MAMVKRHNPPETGETVCPACGAAIKAGSSSRRRRVQCPKCREVVYLDGLPVQEPEASPPKRDMPEAAAENRSRIDSLEARVEALEATLRDAMAAGQPMPQSTAQRKMLWITTTPGRTPEFSPGTRPARSFTTLVAFARRRSRSGRPPAMMPPVRMPNGSNRSSSAPDGPSAVLRKSLPTRAISGLSLAVPELPVAKDAAATYLALKAAGFETVPILDSTPRRESPTEATALSLTLPPEKAA